MGHGTFIFLHSPGYGWYLSVTAIGLNVSWCLHNVIAWMKNRPFLSRKVSLFYIITVVLCWPYWILEIYANFTYFNNINKLFLTTRPYEPLFRYGPPVCSMANRDLLCITFTNSTSDPWWIFTTISLFYTIKKEYNFGLWELVVVSPRFGVMLVSMCLSIAFLIVDTLSVTNVFSDSLPTGIEPFWKVRSQHLPKVPVSCNLPSAPLASTTNHLQHRSYPSFSNASATQSSSTTSRQPSTGYAATGSASRQTAKSSSPLRLDARRRERVGQFTISSLPRGRSFRIILRGVIKSLLCRGFCIRRKYNGLSEYESCVPFCSCETAL